VACSGFSAPADHRGRGVVGAGTARSLVPSNHASFLSWLKPARSSWSCWRCLACIWRTPLRRSRAGTTSLCDPSDTSFAGLGSSMLSACRLAAETPSHIPVDVHGSMWLSCPHAKLGSPNTAPNCGKARCHRSSSPLSSGLGGKATLTNQVSCVEELFCAPRNRVANELDASAPCCSTNRSNSMPSKLQAG
jgi:hypothetical protein